MLLALIIWFGVRSRLAVVRTRRLEHQRGPLLEDLDAMRLALVPEVPPRVEGLAVSVAYSPAEGPAAGGDFYDVFVPEAGKVAVILGDVSGHGRDALTHATLTHYTLRAYLQAGMEPRSALALAGQVLTDPTREQHATVTVAVFDAHSRILTYANAGHPPPIFHGIHARQPLTSCSSAPIGWGVPTGRRQTSVSFQAGMEACFFSDGLIEARSDGGLFGRERLSEILGVLGPRPTAADVLERVHAESDEALDDMAACILVQEAAGSGAYTHVEELELDASALCRTGVRRFLQACLLPAAEIEHALELAGELAAEFDTALVRVVIDGTGASGVDVMPGSPLRQAA